MHGSTSKIPSKKSHPYIYDVKFLALVRAPYIYIYIYGIIRLRFKILGTELRERNVLIYKLRFT
jgi:hypothetical protein